MYKTLYNTFCALRSILFYLGLMVLVVLVSVVMMLGFWLPTTALQMISAWGMQLANGWLRITCGVKTVIMGQENLPNSPVIFVANHESTWEALYLQYVLRPVTTILKRSLLRLPFFGWGLALTKPIAIDRANPRDALKQVLSKGQKRIAHHASVLVFPEGTRAAVGTTLKFQPSGAMLAKQAGVPIVPVAHNSGDCWPEHSFIKRPGTVYFCIGEAISTADMSTRELTQQAEQWIRFKRASLREGAVDAPHLNGKGAI